MHYQNLLLVFIFSAAVGILSLSIIGMHQPAEPQIEQLAEIEQVDVVDIGQVPESEPVPLPEEVTEPVEAPVPDSGLILEEPKEPVVEEPESVLRTDLPLEEEIEETVKPSSPERCYDADGLDTSVRGRILVNGVPIINGDDFCQTTKRVVEWHCDGNFARTKIIECEGSCNSGVCS